MGKRKLSDREKELKGDIVQFEKDLIASLMVENRRLPAEIEVAVRTLTDLQYELIKARRERMDGRDDTGGL